MIYSVKNKQVGYEYILWKMEEKICFGILGFFKGYN